MKRAPDRYEPRLLADAFARLRRAAMPPTLLAEVQQCWSKTAGERVASEAAPVAERGGVVTVVCRSSVWAAELTLLAPELVERLNTELEGRAKVRALRFVTRPF